MNDKAHRRKRPAPEVDSTAVENGTVSGDEFELGQLNGTVFSDQESLVGSGSEPSDEENESEYSSASEGRTTDYVETTDANGNVRYVYREINPVYDSDDSDAAEAENTIGNIPLSFYDAYPHIGYNINGKRVMRPAKGEALDSLLDSIEIPNGWTGLTDPATGKPLNLTNDELDVLKKLTRNEIPVDGYDPYPDMIEYFSGKLEVHPLSSAPEPKRRFVPSKHEAKRVMKMVKAIREGRIKPFRKPGEEEQDEERIAKYDVWADEAPRPDHIMHIPAPKLPPPGYEESYHPPPEYLPDEEEKTAWNEADEEDKEREYLPTNHDALRKVPGYQRFVKEKFERCLDLYLAPRVRRARLNIDPESLLPKLPDPEDLKPFPVNCHKVLRGHKGFVRAVAFSPRGDYLASGGQDGTVRIWDLEGQEVFSSKISRSDPVSSVAWRPGTAADILAAAAGETIYFIVPELPAANFNAIPGLPSEEELLTAGFKKMTTNSSSAKDAPPDWASTSDTLISQSVILQSTVRSAVKTLSWHRKGDYLVSVSPKGSSRAVAIHLLSQHLTRYPIRRLRSPPQDAHFHPSKPILIVALQHEIRLFDLSQQTLISKCQPGARHISSIDVHPGGDNLVAASYDRKLLWHDLESSSRPYRTMRYHPKAIRAVKFHKGGHPLFADASDDGELQVFHGRVVDDLLQQANIVPLKVLKGHKITGNVGVLALDWHPREPWVVSAGADGTCRLWK